MNQNIVFNLLIFILFHSLSFAETSEEHEKECSTKVILNDFQGALESCSKAIELDSKNGNAFALRGIAKSSLRDYKGTIEDISSAIKLDVPTSITASLYFIRGFSKFQIKDYKGAIADLTKTIELGFDGTNLGMGKAEGRTYTHRANAKFELEDYNGAIVDLSKAIELDPENASAYKKRGLAKLELKDKDGCWDLNKAHELGSKSVYHHIKEHCK